ncbi:MAG TPA: Holliday junction resolvase RuvX [Phycisphaerales bacterium]|nr:Holliday junction resolvase RuvX [Phycisphaerales bacterium]
MKYLAIDPGDQRTGLAVGDDETGIVSPLRVIEIPAAQEARLLAEVAREVDAHKPDAIVLGLPLNMDGTEGPAAKRARVRAEALRAKLNLPVHFQDERLTSSEADWRLAGSGLTRGQKKSRRDALAAAAILEDFLADRRRGLSSGGAPPSPTAPTNS